MTKKIILMNKKIPLIMIKITKKATTIITIKIAQKA
jgi:hypothetical protein